MPVREERRRVVHTQPRLDAPDHLGPRRHGFGGRGRALDLHERVRAVEVERRTRGALERGVGLAGAERAEHLVDEVLGGQALDQLDLRQARGRQVRGGAQQLHLLGREAPARARAAAQHAEAIVAGDDRRHHHAAALLARPEAVRERAAGDAVGPVAVEHVEQQPGALHAPPRAGLLGRARRDQLEVAARGS